MKGNSMDKQDALQDELIGRLSLHDTRKADDSIMSTSEMWCEKLTEGKHYNSKCIECSDDLAYIRKSSRRYQSYNDLTLQSSTNFGKDLVQHSHRFIDFAASHITCTAAPPLNIPVNFSLSKHFKESFKLHRTRSKNYYNNALIQYASAFGQGKIVISPSGKWNYDLIEGNDKTGNISKGSLVIHLGDLNNHTSLSTAKLIDIRDEKLAQSLRCPSLSHILEKPREEISGIVKRRSASKMSDITFLSCSSSKSTCSYLSEASEHDIITKGLLRCIWKNGVPYFVFSIIHDEGEVYVAHPWKVKSLEDKALDYIYVFHSWTGSKKGDSVVGKMKVSSSLAFSSSRSKIMETEFVLYDAGEGKIKDGLISTAAFLKKKGLSKKVWDMFRPNNSTSQNLTSRTCELNLDFERFFQELFLDEFNQLAELDLAEIFRNSFRPNLELAAIVIKDYQNDKKKDAAVGGWGLKFLKKPENAGIDHSSDLCLSMSNCHVFEDQSARSVCVLVPDGVHGGPCGGASSLTERWRTGGYCDCGGWDAGCPLTALHNRPTYENTNSSDMPLEERWTVDLFVQGARQDEPALKVLNVQEGLYAVHFQSNISALQSFAIAVAMVHSRMPSLSPSL